MADAAPHSHLPYGADGSGFYSDNTLGCYDVIDSTTSLMKKSIEHIINERKPKVFVICDYGTADGGTSMPMLYKCIEKIKELCGEEQNVHIIYEDQATNDFKSLFLRIQGLIACPNSSFVHDFKNVFVTACGTSFYSQCLPPESINLGFAATCMHWLQKKPCNITNGLHHTQITVDSEKQLYAEQAARDWELILLKRAVEMKEGARFVFAQFCIDKDGYYVGKSKHYKNHMLATMNELFVTMVTAGKITQDEYNNTNFICYYRTIEELTAPFNDQNSSVKKAGLSLVSIATEVVRCPYNRRWMENPDDAVKHAKLYIPTTRTWSNHTFFSGLNEKRSEEERRLIVDEFFQLYEKKVSLDPSQHGIDFVHAHIVIEKKL